MFFFVLYRLTLCIRLVCVGLQPQRTYYKLAVVSQVANASECDGNTNASECDGNTLLRNDLCCHRTRVSRMPEMRSCLRKRLYVSVSRTVGAYGCTCRPSRATLARLAVQRIVEMQRKSDSPPQAEIFWLVTIENGRNTMEIR